MRQPTHKHDLEQETDAWKHSQYFFKHIDLRHLQPTDKETDFGSAELPPYIGRLMMDEGGYKILLDGIWDRRHEDYAIQ